MTILSSPFRRGLAGLAILIAAAVPVLAPSPARAWWVHGGWRPGPVVVARPYAYAPRFYAPRVYAAPAYGVAVAPYARAGWVPGHWTRWGRWVPPHWR